MLQTLALIHKKTMNRIINEIIEERFDKEDNPITRAVKEQIGNITKEFIEKAE